MILVAGLTAATPALARLGETFAGCTRRYGRAVSTRPSGNEVVSRYRKGDYNVKVVFARGRAAEITYSRKSGALLTNGDLNLFLKVNAESSKWVKVDQLAEWKAANKGREKDERCQEELMRDLASFYLWSRQDGLAEASYDRENGELFICDAQRLLPEQKPEPPVEPDNPLGF